MNYLFVVKDASDLEKYEKRINSYNNETNRLYVYSLQLNGCEPWFEEHNVDFLNGDIGKCVNYQEAYEIIANINKAVQDARVNEPWVYELGFLIEGGIQQRIHDSVALCNLYLSMISSANIDMVFYSGRITIEEQDVLINISSNMLSCPAMLLGFSIMHTLHKMVTTHQRLQCRIIRFMSYAWRVLVYLRIIRIKARCYKTNIESLNKADVVFLSEYTNTKHTNWTIKTMNNVGSDIRSCVVVFGDDSNNDLYRRAGINVVSAERYFQFKSILSDWLEWKRDLNRILPLISSIESTKVGGEIVGSCIKKYMYSYLCFDIVLHISRKSILEEVFKCTVFKNAFIKGDSNCTFPRIAYYSYKKTKKATLGILKDDSFGFSIFNPECGPDPYSNIIKAYFINKTLVDYHERKRKGGFRGKVFISPVMNRNEVRCTDHSTDAPVLLWAPSYVLLGYGEHKTFERANHRVFELANSLMLRLLVKYHPAQAESDIQHFVKEYQSENISFFNKDEAIESLLEMANVVITTPSIVCFDALKKGKILIVILDGCENQSIIPDARENLIMVFADQLEITIKQIISSYRNGDKDGYLNNILNKEERFLDEYISDGDLVSIKEEVLRILGEERDVCE